MDAPTYPAAAGFEQPVGAPYVLSIDSASVAELMQMPPAWSIVLKHLPALKMLVSTPQIKPYLGDMTVKTVGAFVSATPEVYTAIDAELRLLPPVQDVAS